MRHSIKKIKRWYMCSLCFNLIFKTVVIQMLVQFIDGFHYAGQTVGFYQLLFFFRHNIPQIYTMKHFLMRTKVNLAIGGDECTLTLPTDSQGLN